MSEIYRVDPSPEVMQRCEQEEIYCVDWRVQAQGCEAMYRLTGDPDFELNRIECEEKARLQQEIFEEIARLETGLKLRCKAVDVAGE